MMILWFQDGFTYSKVSYYVLSGSFEALMEVLLYLQHQSTQPNGKQLGRWGEHGSYLAFLAEPHFRAPRASFAK